MANRQTEADRAAHRLPEVPGFRDLVQIGRGGFSVVFAAAEISSGLRVALKVLEPAALSRGAEVELYALSAAADVPRVAGYQRAIELDADRVALVMDLYQRSLADVIASGTGRRRDVVRWMVELSETIDLLHSRIIFHRDIKPSNVLLSEDGSAVLADFGLAVVGEATLDTPTALSTAYAPPERFRGDVSDLGAGDRYSLACTAFEALSASLPFGDETDGGASGLAARVASRPVPKISTLSDEVNRVLAIGLAKRASLRYDSASRFADSLRIAIAAGPQLPVVPLDRPGTATRVVELPVMERGGSHPIVGRADELEQLERLIRRAVDGDGQLVELAGPPGIGKTRLVGALVEQTGSRLRVAAIAGREGPGSQPYQTIGQLLCELLDLGPDAADIEPERLRLAVTAHAPGSLALLPLIATALGLEVPATAESNEVDPEFRQLEVRRAFADLIDAALPAPALLVLDGCETVDRSSADAWRDVVARLSVDRLVVVTRRESGPDAFWATIPSLSFTVQPLGPDEIRKLVSGVSSRTDSGTIAARSGGNPLFALELAALDVAESHRLPINVERTILARLERLHPDQRRFLETIAVLGDQADENIALEVHGDSFATSPGSWGAIGELLVRVGNVLTFRERLVGEVTAISIEPTTLAALHRKACRVFGARSKDPHSAELVIAAARHAGSAEDATLVWRFGRRAAAVAEQRFALGEALALWQPVLAAADKLEISSVEQRLEMHEAVARLLEATGDFAAAEVHLGIARGFATRPIDLSRLERRSALVNRHDGEYEQALVAADRALEMAPNTAAGRIERTEITVLKASIQHRRGKYLECRAALEPLLTSPNSLAPAIRAHVFDLWDSACIDGADPTSARFGTEALELYEAVGDLRGVADASNNAGINAYNAGDYDEAIRWYERSRSTALRIGDRISAATALNNIGEVLSDQGLLEEARHRFDQARTEWAELGYRIGSAFADRNIGRLLGRAGREDEATPWLDRAAEEFRVLDNTGLEAETQLWLVEILLAQGDLEAAAAKLADVPIDPQIEPIATRLTAELHERSGRPDLAAEGFLTAIQVAEQAGLAFEQALSKAGLALVSGDTDAIAAAADALSAIGAVPGGWASARL